MEELLTGQILFFGVLGIAAFIGINFIIGGIFRKESETMFNGIIIAMFVTLAGVIGAIPTPYSDFEHVPANSYEFVETERNIFALTDDNKLFTFNKILDFKVIDSTTKFMYYYRLNFYNQPDDEKERMYYIHNGIRQYSLTMKKLDGKWKQ